MSETRKTLDWTKPLQRVDGELMKFKEFQSDDHYPIVCVDSAGSEWCFTGSGRVYFPDHGIETSRDLVNVPEPTEQPSIGDDDLRERVSKLESELREAIDSGMAISAGQCVVDGGLLSGDGGSPYCSLQQQLATATAERDEARAKLRKRTSEVETWLGVILQANEAIDGNVDEPEKLPGRVAKLVSQLATHREAAESLEALEGGKVTSVQQVVTGNRWFAACLGAIHFADTPTAAILAARDAANTGEKK